MSLCFILLLKLRKRQNSFEKIKINGAHSNSGTEMAIFELTTIKVLFTAAWRATYEMKALDV